MGSWFRAISLFETSYIVTAWYPSISSTKARLTASHSYCIDLVCATLYLKDMGPVSWKSRKRFGPEKPFVKLRPAHSVKLVFSYVAKRLKIKITAKFRVSRRLRLEDTKRIMSPERFRDFEKRAHGKSIHVAPWCTLKCHWNEIFVNGIIAE